MAENSNVACIADFFRQIDSVKNELRFEKRIFLGLGQKTEVDADPCTFQRFVDETGMAAFVTRQQFEQPLYVRAFGPFGDFRIEDATGKFRCQRTCQEIDKFCLQFGLQPLDHTIEPVGFFEMPLVGIAFHFFHQAVPLAPHRRHIHLVHRHIIGRVKTRRKYRVLSCNSHCVMIGHQRLFDFSMGVHHNFPGVKLTSYNSAISKWPANFVHVRRSAPARCTVALR